MSELAVNEAFLEQVELLQTLLKNCVAGAFGGSHQSKSFGSSCEFTDYRDYLPGDDITKIDWNAFARFEKLYLKLYLDERQTHARIYLDASRSMSFGKGEKDVQAIRLAATFAYLAVCEMDRVSVYAMRENRVEPVIENILGKEAYFNNVGKLNDIVFDGASCRISEAILPTKVGYGDGLSVIISDFLTDEDFVAALDHLASKRRDILCVQVLSKDELAPKVRGKMHFYDSENAENYYRKNISKEIIRAYRRALEYATGRVRENCAARGGSYILVSDDDPLQEVFFDKLVESGVLK